MSKKVRLYTLNDPETKQIRYVGITKQELSQRLREHTAPGRLDKPFHRNQWIKSLLRKGLKPTINLVLLCDETNWQDLERMFIKYYRSIGCDLVNSRDGGYGNLGHPNSPETRAKISASSKGKPRTGGWKHTEEWKKNHAEMMRGRKHSPEAIAKVAESNRGSKRTPEQRVRMSEACKNRVYTQEGREIVLKNLELGRRKRDAVER